MTKSDSLEKLQARVAQKVAHTPGPWRVEMDGCETSHGMPIITKANRHLLAMLADRNEANARLIAAAPKTAEERDELLEALRGLLREFVPSRDTFTRQEQTTAFNAARAAIAKVEGRGE